MKILGQRGLPINVTFMVPTALGGTPLWDALDVTPDQVTTPPRPAAPQKGLTPISPPQMGW